MINSIKTLKLFYQRPILIEKIWGGNLLSGVFRKPCSDNKFIGESIEFSPIRIDANVLFLLTEDGFKEDKNFSFDEKDSLLFKLINSKEDLSIQVHPSDEIAQQLENKHYGKSEAWFVLRSEPGSKVGIGIRERISVSEIVAHCKKGDLSDFLNWIPVTVGDLLYIPSGTIHAIGAGLILAEIQQPSDITYRLFDYNRKDKNGSPRQLHLDKALLAINNKAMGRTFMEKIQSIRDEFKKTNHVALDFFCIDRYVSSDVISELHINCGGFSLFFVESGCVRLSFEDAPTVFFFKGETFGILSKDIDALNVHLRGVMIKFSKNSCE